MFTSGFSLVSVLYVSSALLRGMSMSLNRSVFDRLNMGTSSLKGFSGSSLM